MEHRVPPGEAEVEAQHLAPHIGAQGKEGEAQLQQGRHPEGGDPFPEGGRGKEQQRQQAEARVAPLAADGLPQHEAHRRAA